MPRRFPQMPFGRLRARWRQAFSLPLKQMSDTVSMDDILSDQSVLLQRQSDTTALLTNQIINVSASSLKPILLQWASFGFPTTFILLQIPIDLPEICSDGVSRSAAEYIDFCMGDLAPQVYTALSAKLPGILVSYAINYNTLVAYISKA